jgi:hypothetical protein
MHHDDELKSCCINFYGRSASTSSWLMSSLAGDAKLFAYQAVEAGCVRLESMLLRIDYLLRRHQENPMQIPAAEGT